MITVVQDLSELSQLTKPLHLAMGVFDGVHIGHQEVIAQVVTEAQAKGGIPAVLTFDPFPLQVLAPDRAPQKILANIAHKKSLLAAIGVEYLIVIPFDQKFANLRAGEFLDLIHQGGVLTQISIGEDWKFGKGREGSLLYVQNYCDQNDILLTAVPPVIRDGERISSTRIRQAIRDGNLTTAKQMLGRDYSLFGDIERGDQIGRTIGFPTANVDTKNELLPPNGVYAALSIVGSRKITGVANLGVRPTVTGENKRKFEVHLFDFDEDIYDEEIEVVLGEFIRGEQKFEGLEELKQQITNDCTQARSVEWNL